MYFDEKIASMDRLRRENIRKEREKKQQQEVKKNLLTIEEALTGIEKGELQLEGMPLIEFDTYTVPEHNIPFTVMKNFYDGRQEDEEGVIFLKRAKEISQIISWPKTIITPTTFDQWGNLLVNGMAANRLYADIKKKKQLNHIEYICYEVPSGKGKVYNVMFRFREKGYPALGNYNCMEGDKDTFGVIFEAMLAALDQWTELSIRETQDGKNKESEDME